MPAAVITGASTGIGRAFAHICAREGYDLILIARSYAQLESVAAEINQNTSRKVILLNRDLSQMCAPREVFDQIAGMDLDVEILINNAGFGLLGRFWELDARQQVDMIQVNITALTELTRLFLPGFIDRRRGRILNVASTAAFQPGPLMAVYYATKSYVLSFSEAVHNEARDYGVTVTCLCPGPTKTEFQKRAGLERLSFFTGRRAMDAAEVAEIGFKAMKAGQPLVIAGTLNRLTAFMTRFAPIQLSAGITRNLQQSK